MNYQYEILKLLINNGGIIDVDHLISQLSKDSSKEDFIILKKNILDNILTMQNSANGLIGELPTTSDFFNKYLNNGWASQLYINSIVKVQITTKGRTEFETLDKLYNPPVQIIPHQNTYITTYGQNSPVAGHNLTMGNINTNEESNQSKEVAKKGLVVNKWVLFVSVVAIIVAIILWYFQK